MHIFSHKVVHRLAAVGKLSGAQPKVALRKKFSFDYNALKNRPPTIHRLDPPSPSSESPLESELSKGYRVLTDPGPNLLVNSR